MTIDEVEKDLQLKAKGILTDLNLISLFTPYGTVKVIGSVALGLMTRNDIDIEITVKDFTRQNISDIIQILLQTPLPRIDFTIMDNTNHKSANLPFGFYLGIKYSGKDKLVEKYKGNPDVWQIDCWFLKEEDLQGSKVTKEIKEKLTDEKRIIILKLKTSLMENPDFKGSFNSIDIYNAVLDKDIATQEEFMQYLYT